MKKISRRRWASFTIWAIIYTLFCIWMENLWLLLGLVVLVDVYLTKRIPWGAWKKSKHPKVQEALEWIDDILFALVAVYLINLFVFQNYQIPTSSLEKTLLVGDYLFVSKLSYGPRVPNTPLSFPLVQNTFPIINTKSYLEWPNWGYKRVKGLGTIERNDIVVFNFPAGDTLASIVQNPDYYQLLHFVGREEIMARKDEFGEVIYRPVDKRDNYVKRCVGMPGDSLQIINNQVYINGQAAPNPEHIQFNYFVETNGAFISESQFKAMDVSKSDRELVSQKSENFRELMALGFTPDSNGMFTNIYRLPLTYKALALLQKNPVVTKIQLEDDRFNAGATYPVGYPTGWSQHNFGPIWIPKKGATIELNEWNLAFYSRCIRNYENNEMSVSPQGQVLINGKPATSYTFRYDYYFMMGDNRHNSADSRSWGFVPEDHVVGKPILVWLSLDKDYGLFNGGIRWERMFRKVHTN